jgi:coenzyme F420-reducing hydrogenase delta subunit
VVAAKEDAERYPQATRRARRRFEQAQRLLAEIGADPKRVQWLELADSADETVREALAGAAQTAASR